MKFEAYLDFELEFYDKFNKGFNTVESILANSTLTEDTINIVLNKLIGKNEIVFNKVKKVYEYVEKTEQKRIILNGNLVLPVTVIKRDGKTYVSRGHWYEFDGDFDVKNIIWNVEIPDANNKSIELIDLVSNNNQLMTHKTAKIKQVEAYEKLRDVIIPINDKLVLKLITIGETLTDTELIFNLKINSSGLEISSRKMRLKTTISTKELLDELNLMNTKKHDFSRIKFNKIFNLTDFMVKGNCFPIEISDEQIKYLELKRTKSEVIFKELIHNIEGESYTNNEHTFSIGDGFNFIRELFDEKVNDVISDCGIYLEE